LRARTNRIDGGDRIDASGAAMTAGWLRHPLTWISAGFLALVSVGTSGVIVLYLATNWLVPDVDFCQRSAATVESRWLDLAADPAIRYLDKKPDVWCDVDDPYPGFSQQLALGQGQDLDAILASYRTALAALGWTEHSMYPVCQAPVTQAPTGSEPNLCFTLEQPHMRLTAQLSIPNDRSHLYAFSIEAKKRGDNCR
jgi:hypothetical protein